MQPLTGCAIYYIMANLNNRTVAILTEEGFEQVELTSPKEALEAAVQLFTSYRLKAVRLKHGIRISGELK
jgi:hypothetical protein